MTDEIKPTQEDIDEFNDLVDGLNSGIQTVLSSIDENADVEYVLCVRHTGADMLSMSTNAQPQDALGMVMQIGQKMHQELNDTKADKPKIVLPH